MSNQTAYEDIEAMLDEILDELPEDICRGLNGGVILVPSVKMHPERKADDLYILGEYHVKYPGLGRYVTIYFGSFVSLYDNAGAERQRNELRKILYHELLHHMESLAGERDLEIKDAEDLEKYRRKFRL